MKIDGHCTIEQSTADRTVFNHDWCCYRFYRITRSIEESVLFDTVGDFQDALKAQEKNYE